MLKEEDMAKNTAKDSYKKIPLDSITVSQLNVRQTLKDEDIDDLAISIKKLGLLVPISVFEKDGKYILISGQRRFLAFKKLSQFDSMYKEIPAVITKVDSDLEVTVKSFVENIQRRDLSYRDKLQAATVLMVHYNNMATVASVLGVSVQTVKYYLGYSAVPEEIKRLVDEGKLGAKTALNIFQKIDDSRMAIKVAENATQYRTAYERSLLISLSRKYPDKSLDEIRGLVSHIGPPITLHLDPDMRDKLKRASDQFGLEENDIILQAIDEWLDRNPVKEGK
jgi:ParB family chromosome partitioning protein